MKLYKWNFIVLVFCSCLFSCTKKTTSVSTTSCLEYYPLKVGSTFFYRYDSIIPINFGASLATHSYIAKDSFESTFLNQLGQTSFRIHRYLRDTAQTQPWKFNTTNIATINGNNIEYVDNNLRYIILSNFVNSNFSWKGNSYINTQSPSPYYYLDNWDYRYTNIDQPFKSIKQNFDSTFTVLENQDSSRPVFDPAFYYSKTVSKSVYAKNVGLIYKDFLFFIWQPPAGGAGKYQDDAMGIRMNLIDYK